jgi:gliding-associated putative ABC transporter substrate-binding component GldG
MKKVSYLTSILLLVAIFVVIAAISEYFFFRVDLTEGGQYSLSKATKNILKNLDSPVTVTAYFTGELAPDLAKVKDNFRDMLIEYNSLSGGNVVYKFEDPNKDEKLEADAQKAGVRPVLFNVREKDEVKQQKIYMGAVIKYGNESETLPFIDPKSSLEYMLSTAIKKLTVKNKPMIGFIQGQGEPPVNAYQQLMNELNVLYNVKPVTLADTTKGLNMYKTLVIVAPKDTFDIKQLDLLDNYLNNGGNLFLAIDHVEGDLQTLTGKVVHTGLVNWLNKKGLTIKDGFVVDAQCGSISVSQRTNFGVMTSQLKFPYFPLISNFPDHPITRGLEQVFLSFTSPIQYTGDTSMRFTPLATTSDQSGIQKLPVYFDVNKQWTQSDFTSPKSIVAGLLEEKAKNGGTSRLILVSNGDFAVNGTGQRPQQKQPDNISLMANGIDFLTDDTGLIDLRTKTITSRPIEQMSDAKKTMVKWLNFLLPILLVIIYGLIRMQYRRNQRIKRMEEGYVK